MDHTYQSVVIDAPVEKVWSAIRDFHNLSWAPNVVTSAEKVGETGGQDVGAVRVLNGVFRETLLTFDAEDRTFSYSIDDGPSPVAQGEVQDYVGRVQVRPVTEGGGTFVEWSSRWQEGSDEVYAFCHPIYVALLADMKRSLE